MVKNPKNGIFENVATTLLRRSTAQQRCGHFQRQDLSCAWPQYYSKWPHLYCANGKPFPFFQKPTAFPTCLKTTRHMLTKMIEANTAFGQILTKLYFYTVCFQMFVTLLRFFFETCQVFLAFLRKMGPFQGFYRKWAFLGFFYNKKGLFRAIRKKGLFRGF